MFAIPDGLRLEAIPRDPKDRQSLSRLVLDLDRVSFAVRQTVIESANGDRTENRFTITEVNVEMPGSLFQFAPPPNTKVVSPFGK